MKTSIGKTILASLIFLLCLPAVGGAQGIEAGPDDAPIGVEDMVPGAQRKGERHEPGWLGVMLEKPASADAEHAEKAPAKSGVDVVRVLRDSPAQKAGLKKGDRILKVNQTSVGSPADVQKVVRNIAPGGRATLELSRAHHKFLVQVTVGAAPSPEKVLRAQFVGHPAPAFRAIRVGDTAGVVTASDFAGRPLVVDFWATWCGPCRPMSRKLAKLDEKLGDRVRFIGLTSESPDTVRRYLDSHSHGFAVASADDKVMQSYLIESYPTVFVIDKDGRVAGVFIGLGHIDEIETLVEKLAGAEGADEQGKKKGDNQGKAKREKTTQ